MRNMQMNRTQAYHYKKSIGLDISPNIPNKDDYCYIWGIPKANRDEYYQKFLDLTLGALIKETEKFTLIGFKNECLKCSDLEYYTCKE